MLTLSPPPLNSSPLTTHTHTPTHTADAGVAEARAALAALQPPPEIAAFQAAKEVFDEVARHHPILRGVLETLIGEVRGWGWGWAWACCLMRGCWWGVWGCCCCFIRGCWGGVEVL